MNWSSVTLNEWLARQKGSLDEVKGTVTDIIEQVRNRGDEALFDYCEKFDKIRPEHLIVTDEQIDAAFEQVSPEVAEALSEAYARISRFHELQQRETLWLTSAEPGITLGVKTSPLDRIGIYVPGGRASYPSTVLMCAVPASVAGVRKIVCCTPPPIHPLTLVACEIAGVHEVYQVGGAQAIAAMAYGTESIAPVEKIVGPGNRFVTAAKMMVRDTVEIDFPAGPSEIAIIADGSARPDFIAADILAQCEHDPQAASILITPSTRIAQETGEWVARLLSSTPRKEIIEESLHRSGFLITDTLAEAVRASDQIAPEHLSLQVQDPLYTLQSVKNAGSIFIGPYTPVACGDYASGTNHVLPTAGNARLYSGLNVAHFTKTSTVQMMDPNGLEAIGDIVEVLADAEGLHAHADSVRIRRRTE